ncbi:hypothetical protein [Lysobacter gummosus]
MTAASRNNNASSRPPPCMGTSDRDYGARRHRLGEGSEAKLRYG